MNHEEFMRAHMGAPPTPRQEYTNQALALNADVDRLLKGIEAGTPVREGALLLQTAQIQATRALVYATLARGA